MVQGPALSVIVPTLNRQQLLRRQLQAILAQSTEYSFEVVVVDNGSHDGTQEAVGALASADPRVRLVVATAMSDAAYARNVGAGEATGRFLAFVDDDDLVGDGWLTALAKSLAEHRLVAPRIDYELLNEPQVVDGWPMTQATHLHLIDGMKVCTGHFGIHADLWRELGGQRTGFFVGEDMEISLRANRDLGVVPYLESAAVYHRLLPATVRASLRQGRRDGRGRVQWSLDEGRRWATRRELASAVRAYWWLISRLPRAILGTRRHLWALHLGERLGRIEQSFRMRAFLP